MTTPSIITIGNFDGVHIGHAALIRRIRELAAPAGARALVLAFDPHPAATLRPDAVPPRLTTWERRMELLRELGADDVVRLEPTRDLLAMMPHEFVEWLVREFAPLAVVEGPDFRFGHGRSGTIQTLSDLGQALGFTVDLVQPVESALADGTAVRASSTLARWLLEHGRIGDAAAILGRCYEVDGEVEAGDRRGRKIGFPTANLRTPCLLPADGVYAGLGVLQDGRRLTAAISVGSKPTFGEHRRIIEAYLLPAEPEATGPRRPDDAEAWHPLPGLPEYGWRLRLEIRHWLRDQVRYGTLEDLLQQMARDCQRTRELVESPGTSAAKGVAACR